MQKILSFPFQYIAALAFVWLVSISGGACSQNASLAKVETPNVIEGKTEKTETASSTDSLTSRQIEAAQKQIEKNPNAPNGYTLLAVAYIHSARETGDFSLNSKAETAINRAAELDPNNYDAQKIKASLLLTFHRFEEGLAAGITLQKAHPQDAFAYGILTDANVELGNYKEAVDAVQQMVDLRPNMESYARVSYVRSLHGDPKGAIEAMNTAAKIADPMDKEAQAWCLVHLGDELFKTGNYTEAERQYDSALNVFPNYHFALTGKGHARAAANDYENAAKFFAQSQEKIPLTLTVIALGDVYTKLGRAEDARKQYDLAEFIEQKFGNIDRRTLALLWADRDIKLDDALSIAETEHARRKDIFSADIYAWCLYKKGRFQEAKQAITEAMHLKTKDARIFYHAGMIEKGLGNQKEAKLLLQTSVKTSPSFDILQAEKARAALQELK